MRQIVAFRVLFLLLLAAGLCFLTTLPGRSADSVPSRDQQAKELEKQIKDLTGRLEELRRVKPAKPLPPLAEGTIPPEWIKGLNWRSIGPAAMGGRISALAVCETDPTTYWVATASGGLLKTINNGTTIEHQFDQENTVSIGDVCVAPSDRNILWVGTGENNPRNSVSFGDGVYKSTDGGKTWKNMGLKKTFQIGRIAIHPRDPNTVYVGALGRLYGPNEERGLFKTTDGGQSWKKILYINDKTGVIDVQMSPANPETLLVATWERQRDEFDSHPGTEMPPAEGYDRYDPIKKWGPGSGLYKTTDGGKTFKKITAGLPTCALGRIGLSFNRKNPAVVFAIVESEKIAMGLPPVWLGAEGENVEGGVRLTRINENSPAAKASLKVGDVVTALDKKPFKNLEEFTFAIESRKAGDKVTLTIRRDKATQDIAVTIEVRPQAQPTKPVAGGFLGVQTEAVEKGLRVTQVVDESPAAAAGIKKDDVIVAVDKKDVKDTRAIFEALRGHKPGEQVPVTVLRGTARTDLAITLGRRGVGGRRTPGKPTTEQRPYSSGLGGQRENVQHQQGPDGFQFGGVYRSVDGGDTWTRVNSVNPRPMYFSQIRVDPNDENFVYVLGVSLYRSNDGGKKFTADGGRGVHADQHALWIDPRDGRHMIVGCDGGFYATYDRMANWDFLNTTAIGQFYHVAVDSRRPYWVYGGLQDNGSWGGPSRSLRQGGTFNEDWIMMGGGDGFVCRVDPNDPDVVYWEMQDGGIMRRNLRTNQGAMLRVSPQEGKPPYRFNWNTPFILSSHNAHIFYNAGNYVFRSVQQGNELKVISPEITRTKRGSASALAESPRNPDLLWVGSDDGFLWVTRNGGKDWTNVTDKIKLPGPRWVATIEPSRFVEGRAYVAFDAHRSNDDEPYIYVTEDFGQTWKSLRGNLPIGSTRVLREDMENQNLLWLGTEFALWASLNRGGVWLKVNNNLPTVAVHELAAHPTCGELVAATHGRSIWIADVSPLRQMTPEALKAPAYLYRPVTAIHWRTEPGRGTIYGSGARKFYGQNPPAGASIYYSLREKADKVSLKVVDYSGRTISELEVKKEPGLHRSSWNLTSTTPRTLASAAAGGPGKPGGRPGGFSRSGMWSGSSGQPGMRAGGPGKPGTRAGGPGKPGAPAGFPGQFVERAPAGTYRVVLTVDGLEFSQPLRVEDDLK